VRALGSHLTHFFSTLLLLKPSFLTVGNAICSSRSFGYVVVAVSGICFHTSSCCASYDAHAHKRYNVEPIQVFVAIYMHITHARTRIRHKGTFVSKCIHISKYICTQRHLHSYIHTHVHAHAYIGTRTHTHMHICICVYGHAYTCMPMHTCVHALTAYTHTYLHSPFIHPHTHWMHIDTA
jgi:hypothetical protein